MESRFANSFFSVTTNNNNNGRPNNNNRRILENRNGESHQHKRPKLDICLPGATCAFKETSQKSQLKVTQKSLIEDESIWEDFDEEDVLEKAECIERASQALAKSSEESDRSKCDIEKSGLLTKPIVKPREKPTTAVNKYPQAVATQKLNSPQTIAKEQLLKKNVIFKAASTGNMKTTQSPSSTSSSSGISLFSQSSFSPRIKVTTKNSNEESHASTKAPQANKCKDSDLLSTQLHSLTDRLQTKDGEESDRSKCDIEKSGLLTKPIVKPREKPTTAVNKYPQVVATQKLNSPQTIAKEQLLKKNVIFKAASTGNMKTPQSPASSSSSSGISLLSQTSFTPRIKVTTKNTNEESHASTKAPQTNKCKDCELLSTQLHSLTDRLQTKDGEISLLRSNLEEVRSKSFKGKDEMGSLFEKTRLLEKTISDQNTVINFMSGELQSKSQTCDRLKSSLKQRRAHSSFSTSSKASANKSTITNITLAQFPQQKEMSFSPAMLTQLAKHDGRLLFDICSAELTESHRPISFLESLDGAGQDLQDDRWFVSMLFEFQKHQSFSTELAANCLDKLIAICRSSVEEIDKNREATVSQSQRIKELYNKHHEIAPLSRSYRFFSPKPWYSEESGIKVRRLLHLISRIIDIEPKLAHIVVPPVFLSVDKCEYKLPKRNSETPLLHVLRDTLKLIKDECYSLNLNGFLASSASLIISIMKSKIELNEEGQKLINEIFRMILLCCPGPTAMLFSCKFLLAVDDKYSFINSDLCRNTPAKDHLDSERSSTFDEGTCSITLICYLVQAMKNDPKIYLITDVLVRWLRILQTKWDKINFPPWLNWGSLAQLPANHKLLCDCRFELNKLIMKLLYEAAELFSNESHKMKQEEKRSLEMLLDCGIALIFAAAIGEDRSLSIEPGEIEAHYELYVHTLSNCSNLNVSSIQQKNLKHLALQEIKEPPSQAVTEDDECTELFRKMCTF